ncbi:unnamed protein product, partial [Rotaria sp. Silwood1]
MVESAEGVVGAHSERR